MPKLDEVFGVSRDVPLNYVVRDSVDGKLVDALTRDQHIVVFGSSKQGKTCLRKYNLKDDEYVAVTCSNRWTLGQLNAAVLKAVGYVVEGTSSRTVTGESKIAARLGGGFNLFGNKIDASAGVDSSEGTQTSVESQPLELDPSDVNDIIEALEAANAPHFIVLEDFHYLPEETQKDFAVALKAFHEDSSYCFVIVGVWLDQNRLVQHNGDLTGRVVSVDADKWSSDELLEVIEGGEQLLNVRFSDAFKDELLDGCFESIYVVQESCRRACEQAGVHETKLEPSDLDGDANALIQAAVDAHSARYNGFIINFALGFQTSALEMYRWLLYPVLTADVIELERGLKYGDLRLVIDEHHPESPINQGNITQALRSSASLQVGKMQIKPIILDYDETNRRLNVVDRSFLIWLQHQDRTELLSLAELPPS
jgi:hypothetical protein